MPEIEIDIPRPEKVFNPQFYKRLFDYSHSTEVYWGGASSGKSHGVVQKVIIKSLQDWKSPRKVLWLRKVGSTLRDSIFADVLDGLSAIKLLPYCDVNRSNFEIKLPNGAVFLFKGMDDPEKMKSIKGISDIVMEEATEFNLEDYTQLQLRLRDRRHKHRQIFMMFNPVSKLNWVYDYFFKHEQPDTQIVRSTYKDNLFLDEVTRKHIEDLANSNPTYYKIYALGEFATLDKLIFPKYDIKRINTATPKMRELRDLFGLDFGYKNDPSAFIHLKVDLDNKILYFVEELIKKHALNDELAKMIIDAGYGKEIIYADSAEAKSIDEMKRYGVSRIRPAKKGPNSIIQGVAFLSQFRFVVDDRCVNTKVELDNYTYQKDKKTGLYSNKPIEDAFNHIIDATRYAVEPINGQGPARAQTFKNLFI